MAPLQRPGPDRATSVLIALLAVPLVAAAQNAPAPSALPEGVEALAREALPPQMAAGARVAVEAGALDPRLRLAPCAQIQPWWPTGQKAWGRVRVGLRCVSGPVNWNVYLPLTVKVFARVPVLAQAQPAGTTLAASHLTDAEVDLAAQITPPLLQTAQLVGRPLARALAAGQPVAAGDLRSRQFFATGDTVKLIARGPGFQIAGEGQAMTVGVEGQPSRIRTESGRVVTALPVADRQAELEL